MSTRVLITGFGPFPGVPVNVSSRLALAIGRRARAQMLQLDVVVSRLATSWSAAPGHLERLFLRLDPDVALHFGVSSRARGFELETIAHNVANGAPDEAGGVPGGAQVIPGGPARRRSTFPAREIMARLHQLRLPCRISRDAGRYLCNATLYRSLHLAAGLGRQRVIGFVHIPTTFLEGASAASSLHGLTFQDAVTGGLAILEACHEHAIAGLTAA